MNLKNIPLEKLEALPNKISKKQIFNNKLEVKTEDKYKPSFEKIYKNIRNRLIYLLKKSVNKTHGEIYSKFLEFYNLDFYMQPLDFFNRNIDYIIKTSKGLYLCNSYGRISKLNNLSLETTLWIDEFYFDLDNILRIIPRNKVNHFYDAKSHYSYITKQKKEHKQHKNNSYSITLLQFINKPDLFEFFKKLWRDRIQLEKSIWVSQSRIYDEYKSKFNFTSYYKNEIKLDKIKLEQVNEKINALLKGETNIFYESKEYLYSIKKDCHHFKNP